MLAGGRQGKSVLADASVTEAGVGRRVVQSLPWAFIAGALIGVLGGMIGLGGAEFRLPLLIGVFGFVALQAVIMNKAISLIVVLTALPAQLFAVPWSDVAPALVRGGEPALGKPGWGVGRCDLGDTDAVGNAVSGAGGAAGRDRGCVGVEPFR